VKKRKGKQGEGDQLGTQGDKRGRATNNLDIAGGQPGGKGEKEARIEEERAGGE